MKLPFGNAAPEAENGTALAEQKNNTAWNASEAAPQETEEPGKKRRRGKKEKKKKTPKQEMISLIVTFIVALLVATLVRAFVAEPVRVDGESMTNTLQDGEIVLVSKMAYWRNEPQRNDIVICRYPNRVAREINFGAAVAMTEYEIFVKRLVALPGDTVEIKNGVLYVNGTAVPNPEFMASSPMAYPLRVLGENEYFVMGDNRYTSHDSRSSDVGPISRDMILGKVTRVLLPLSNWRTVE